MFWREGTFIDIRGYLFQGRFGSCVLDERHLLAAVRYVENNPVAAGMTRYAWEYRWSSATYHVGDVKKDILLKSRKLYGLVKDWRKYLLEPTEGRDDLPGLKRLPTVNYRSKSRDRKRELLANKCYVPKIIQ